MGQKQNCAHNGRLSPILYLFESIAPSLGRFNKIFFSMCVRRIRSSNSQLILNAFIINIRRYLVIYNYYFQGTRTEVISSQMGSKIFQGERVGSEKVKYMVSLQLNSSHVCSSGMFQRGFLLTTSMCAWYIGNSIEEKYQKATAVVGNLNLQNGQRVNILKLAYLSYNTSTISTCPTKDDDVGVVMVRRFDNDVEIRLVVYIKIYFTAYGNLKHEFLAKVVQEYIAI